MDEEGEPSGEMIEMVARCMDEMKTELPDEVDLMIDIANN